MQKANEERACDKFYRASMDLLGAAEVPFLVGGAYAFGVYTGIVRETKDFDLCICAADVDNALAVFARAGYQGEKTFPHWLAKVRCGEDFIDLIYRSGNGVCEVNESWFARAHDGKLLGRSVNLCPPEEMIWMKAFIMERERFDGADVAHLIESAAEQIDWPHLLNLFGPDWRVLFSHLVLFAYIFPSERDRIPAAVIQQLSEKLARDSGPATNRICRGTLLSRQQYLRDVQERGFIDGRVERRVHMNNEDIARWTEAIARDGTRQN
jgi:hypothetical protein